MKYSALHAAADFGHVDVCFLLVLHYLLHHILVPLRHFAYRCVFGTCRIDFHVSSKSSVLLKINIFSP